MSLKNQIKYKLFYINPNSIVYCTKESKYCDYTQFDKDIFHPHAGHNRGVFNEEENGLIKIIKSNWDRPGIKFNQLLEYQALKDHYLNKKKWRNSKFAQRLKNYIIIRQKDKLFIKSNTFKKYKKYFNNTNLLNKPSKINELILRRENLIDNLFESIKKNGIKPIEKKTKYKNFIDNISVNVGKGGKIYFNNRGHHRLSIAKILKLNLIPVKITVAKNEKVLQYL